VLLVNKHTMITSCVTGKLFVDIQATEDVIIVLVYLSVTQDVFIVCLFASYTRRYHCVCLFTCSKRRFHCVFIYQLLANKHTMKTSCVTGK
jgi:hypothetical protein